MQSRRAGLERLASTGKIPEAERALAAARLLTRKASRLEKHPDADASLEVLAKHHELLTEELDLIDALAKDPARLEAAGIQRAELGLMHRETASQLDAARDPDAALLPLHLAGLEELVPGALWKGTRDQIEHAVATIARTTPDAKVHHEPGTTRWRIEHADRSVVINERPPTNIHGRGLPPYAIRKSDVSVEESTSAGYYVVTFSSTGADGARIHVGQGVVRLGNHHQPDEPPHFTIAPFVRGTEIEYAVHIHGDVTFAGNGSVPAGHGERTPVTRFVLEQYLSLFEARFGHAPDALGGILAWENLLNFQREWYKATTAQLSDDDAAQAAIRKVSYGKHRVALGYDCFEVSVDRWEWVDLGPGLGVRHVPTGVDVLAHRSER
jgi:hypothetical protein